MQAAFTISTSKHETKMTMHGGVSGVIEGAALMIAFLPFIL